MNIKILLIILFLTTATHAQWEWQNPLPQSNNLHAIEFTSDGIGIAVGDHGTILRSSDNGLSWSIIELNTTCDILDLLCLDNGKIIAIGTDGLTAISEDDGINWEVQSNSIEEDFLSIASYNDSIIWVCTQYYPSETQLRGHVYKSTNYGSDWELTPTTFYDWTKCIKYHNGRLWLCNNDSIFYSDDMGYSWSEPDSVAYGDYRNNYLFDIAFSSDSVGWVSGDRAGILKTTDGGESWMQVVDPPGMPPGPSFRKSIYRFLFKNENEGLYIGKSEVSGRQDSYIGYTTDGGDNWEEISISPLILSDLALLDNKIWITGQAGQLFSNSDNDLSSWERLFKNNYEYQREIKFFDSMVGATTCNYTIDGGENWRNLQETIGIIENVSLINKDTLIASNDRNYYILDLNQETYVTDSIEFETSIEKIEFFNAHYAVFLSHDERIIKYIDNIFFDITPENEDFQDVVFLDGDNFIIITSNNIIKTSDGGATWSQSHHNIVITEYPIWAWFEDYNTGWIFNQSGSIYRSQNSSGEWNLVEEIPSDSEIYSIESNGDIIVMCGSNGSIITSSDNGATWSIENSGTNNSLSSIDILDSDNIWISGANGTIIKRKDRLTSIEKDLTQEENSILLQTYPNPFNSSTVIKFAFPVTSNVNLTIYNIMGQEIKTLSVDNLSAGTQQFTWNGTNKNNELVSSGIYIYRLHAVGNDGRSFSKSAKMVLMK